jgi:hypothetical protein
MFSAPQVRSNRFGKERVSDGLPFISGLQPYSIPAAEGLDDHTGTSAGVSLEIIDDDERAVAPTAFDPDFGSDTG